MFYIRVDANKEIGTGHVMRCLSIAEELRRKSEKVFFLVADESSKQFVINYGFSSICLHSQWNNMEQELDILLKLIFDRQIKQLLVDSYFVTELYLRTLHQYINLAYIDDLNSFIYPVDTLINYNIFADRVKYQKQYQLTELLLGCTYVPLRKEFQKVKKSVPCGRKKILITSGGTDNYNVISNLLDELKWKSWFNNVEFHIILGKFYSCAFELQKRWLDCSNVFFYRNVTDISKYMTECDIAVTAGGSTVYELCACGLPSVIFTMADNQYAVANEFQKKGLIPWCGDVRRDMEKCIRNVIYWLDIMLWDDAMLKQRGKELQQIVDGYGAMRIAERLLYRNR